MKHVLRSRDKKDKISNQLVVGPSDTFYSCIWLAAMSTKYNDFLNVLPNCAIIYITTVLNYLSEVVKSTSDADVVHKAIPYNLRRMRRKNVSEMEDPHYFSW